MSVLENLVTDINISMNSSIKKLLSDGVEKISGDYYPEVSIGLLLTVVIVMVIVTSRKRRPKWSELTESERQDVFRGLGGHR